LQAPKIVQIVVAVTALVQTELRPAASANMTAVAVSEDEKILVLGDENGEVSAWRLSDGQALWTVPGNRVPISDLGFIDSGREVLAIERGHFARLLSGDRAKSTRFRLNYQYYTDQHQAADTNASAIIEGDRLVLGSSRYPIAYLLRTDLLLSDLYKASGIPSELNEIALDKFQTDELGVADYVLATPTGKPSPSVVARIVYGSDMVDDSWTDFAGCPKTPWILSTTRMGYLIGWNAEGIPSLPKELPALKPEYQRQLGASSGRSRALRGVACSVSGIVATIGEGSDRYGELQIWNLSGELLASSNSNGGELFHAGDGQRVTWDASGSYLITAGESEYIVWSWNGSVLHSLATLALPRDRSIGGGRPIAVADTGKFILLSSTGAWLFDATTSSFIRGFGISPAAIHVGMLGDRAQSRPATSDWKTFFRQVLQAVSRPDTMRGLAHPLFHVSSGGYIDLPTGKRDRSFVFSCSFGEGDNNMYDDRLDCVNSLQSEWANVLGRNGLKEDVVGDYSVPGWVRVVFVVRRGQKILFRYVFESEKNQGETSGYASIAILRN
jgi:hypothetical protein